MPAGSREGTRRPPPVLVRMPRAVARGERPSPRATVRSGASAMHHVRHAERLLARREALGFRGRLGDRSGPVDRLADALTTGFGSLPFLVANLLLFAAWIALNTGLVPGVAPFDPFPFNLLTMAVSLEAIVLTVVVLIAQNFQSRIADMRAELDFEINVRAEKEITKLIVMLRDVQERLGIDGAADGAVDEMARETDIREIEEEIRRQDGDSAGGPGPSGGD